MLVSLVIPVFNEAETLNAMLARLRIALTGLNWEVIFVDDGSTDGSLDMIRRAALDDARVRAIGFSRNFGHQTAVTAGLDFAEGDAVVVMDADLQDPPELVPRMVELMEQGYDVVSPRRTVRNGETIFKRWTAAFFYRAMARMVDRRLRADVGDFRLFSRRAVLAIRSFREQHRFMRGLVAWLGLKEAVLPFERSAREAVASTKYSLRQNAVLCLDRGVVVLRSSFALERGRGRDAEHGRVRVSAARSVCGFLDARRGSGLGFHRRAAVHLLGDDSARAGRHRRLRRAKL